MNEATIEHLLHAITPRIELQPPAVAIARDRPAPFDDHLYRVGAIRPEQAPRPAVAPQRREQLAPSSLQASHPSAGSRPTAPLSQQSEKPQSKPEIDAADSSENAGLEEPAKELRDSNGEEVEADVASVEAIVDEVNPSPSTANSELRDPGESDLTEQSTRLLQHEEQAAVLPADTLDPVDAPAAEEAAADTRPQIRPAQQPAKDGQSTRSEQSTDSLVLQENVDQADAGTRSAVTQPTEAESAPIDRGSQLIQKNAPTNSPLAEGDRLSQPDHPEEAEANQERDVPRPDPKAASTAVANPPSSGKAASSISAEGLPSAGRAGKQKNDRWQNDSIPRGAARHNDAGQSASAPQSDERPQPAAAAIALAPAATDAVAVAVPEASTGRESKTAPKSEGLLSSWGRIQRVGEKHAGSRAQEQEGSSKVDPARFVSRVAKAFQTAQQRGGTLQLRLSPPELGSLRLELTVKEGVMTAALETESAATRRVLLEHLPMLRERLAEQNIRIERFDVDVRRDGGGQSGPGAEHHDRNSHPRPDASGDDKHTTAVTESAGPRAAAPLVASAGLNMVA